MEITRESTAYVTGTDKDFPDWHVLGNFWATFGVWSNFLQFQQPGLEQILPFLATLSKI